MSLPAISNYGRYSSENYNAHTLCVDVGPVTIWFSYQTPVAFQVAGSPRVVRANDWGPTTGKHLRWIDGGDKSARVSGAEFERLWTETVLPALATAS
jgi:hypothetical protein